MRVHVSAPCAHELAVFGPFRRQFEDMLTDFGRWPTTDWPANDDRAALVISGEKLSQSGNHDKAWRVVERSQARCAGSCR